MKEIKGNIKRIIELQMAHQHYIHYDAICCTTNTTLNKNNELIMGAGTAKIFKDIFPWLPKFWGNQIIQFREYFAVKPCVLIARIDGCHLVSFPTKTDWKLPSQSWIIDNSAAELVSLSIVLDWNSILLPRPGCGCGDLKWEDVKEILESYLDDRFTIISQ